MLCGPKVDLLPKDSVDTAKISAYVASEDGSLCLYGALATNC